MHRFIQQGQSLIFQAIDDSMVAKGSAIEVEQAVPKPGNCVVVKFRGRMLFRKMSAVNGGIVLSPINTAYKTYHFSNKEWESVEILGVATKAETPHAA